MKEVMNIKISGYYGMMNYGDDLFAYLTYYYTQNKFRKNFSQVVGPRYIDPDLEYLDISFLNKYYNRFDYKGKFARLFNYLQSTINTDYYIFSGGSLFSNSGFNVKDVVFNINFNRYKLHAMGVSIGPFKDKNAEKNNIEKLKRFEYIAVRDDKSFQRISSYNLDSKIVLAGDLAGLGVDLFKSLPKYLNKDLIKKNEINIGFSPCNLQNEKESIKYINNFLATILLLKNEVLCKVKIICLNENPFNGDIELCKYISNLLTLKSIDNEIIYYREIGLKETWHIIENLDFYASVRLHGAITAYLTNTPFFLYEYHEKCTEFLNLIGVNNGRTELVLNNPKALYKIIVDNSKILMPIEKYSENSKLNIEENPLYSKGG